ncbi:hypothetical protein BCR34DRAFT_625700 [Clohesyomyces aquaticus]|uniref:NOT2/NOT3/NOT5 C-terminal domain-containing protein n=1 Tax=Clohesyomyces aquaticus TaxID=1231657 RepID=A0A1Y1ZGY3_9PLEO|nr:hypothetical protein BCR34DRAFT_625700 [Clohesyomyces aquaticus]
MFQNQQNSTARGAPLGSNRLQNGKMGSGSQWGFGGPMGGAPGLSATQSRANGTGLSSFAQTIGSSQPHTPLNLEEFPSLSGAPQTQPNTSAQQMWSNPSLRTAQHSTIQRPQGQSQQVVQPSNAQHQQMQAQSHEEIGVSGQSRFSAVGDDYRFGGQSGVGQLSGTSQPQTGNIEEFPPLGGAGNDVGPDQRSGMIQNAAFGSGPTTNAFPGLGQTRNGLSSPTDGQQDRPISTTVGDRSGGVPRTQFENLRANPAGAQDVDRNGNPRAGQSLGNLSFIGSQLPPRGGGAAPPPIGQRLQAGQYDQNFAAETTSSPNAQLPQHKKLAEMTEAERYGLPGLLSMIPLDSPDYSALAVGQDLTVLGLDLSRPDNSPLHPTFGSPFVDSNVKPAIPPDFTLPVAYTVTNVPPLHTKIGSFNTETLLAIFYQFPRDIMQEIAANELYNRDWRWHTKLQQWMMKDPDLPQPMRISPKEERGWYLFFDVTNWRRERSGAQEALAALFKTVREMNPAHARPVPADPVRFNLLARPCRATQSCRICNFPGHHSDNIRRASACRTALLSTVGFWEDIIGHVSLLYREHSKFLEVIKNNAPTYEMRQDNHPAIPGDMETVLVDGLTRNYLKFQAHCAGLRPKLPHILNDVDLRRLESVTITLNDFLLNGLTLDDLFERSLVNRQ